MGLLTRFRAEDPERRVILPHEHTRKAAKEDRWRLLQTTRVNFSPIFMMFPDPEGRFATLTADTTAQAPLIHFTDDDGVEHRLWRVDEAERVAEWQSFLGTLPGVHRRRAPPSRHRPALARRERARGSLDPRLPDAHRGPGASRAAVPPHPVRGAVARRGGPAAGARTSRSPGVRRRLRGARRWPRRRPDGPSPSPSPAAGPWWPRRSPRPESLLPADAPGVPAGPRSLPPPPRGARTAPRRPDSAVSYVHSLAEAEEAVAAGACRLAVLLRGTPVQQIVGRGGRGRVDAGQEHLLPPQAAFGPRHPSPGRDRRVTPPRPGPLRAGVGGPRLSACPTTSARAEARAMGRRPPDHPGRRGRACEPRCCSSTSRTRSACPSSSSSWAAARGAARSRTASASAPSCTATSPASPRWSSRWTPTPRSRSSTPCSG